MHVVQAKVFSFDTSKLKEEKDLPIYAHRKVKVKNSLPSKVTLKEDNGNADIFCHIKL